VNVQAALLRNTFWYGAVTLVGLVSGLLMSVVLARGLGPARMGDYSYLLWALRALTAVATLGWALATTRYTAAAHAAGDSGRAWSYVRLFLRRQLVTTTLVAVLMLPVVFLVVPEDVRWPFVLLTLLLFPITVENIYTHTIHGAQRYDLAAQTSTVKMTLQLLGAVAVLWLGGGILGLVLALGLGTVVAGLIQRRRAHALFGKSTGARPAAWTPDLRAYLLPLSAVVVLDAIVWDRSEVFFLRLFTSSEEIAFYSLAFGLATKAMLVPEIAVGALLPAFSALHGRGAPEELGRVYRTAIRYVALVGAPIAAIGAALAPGVIVWLYGDAYLPAARLLGALAFVGLVSTMRKVAWAALRAVGDRRCALTATWAAAVLNVGLAAVLIPALGTTGAVLANVAGQVTATVWVFIGMARAHGSGFPTGDLVRIGGCALLTLAAAWVLGGGHADAGRLILAAGVAGAVFVGGCVATRVVGPREWTFLLASTRRLAARGGVAS
jgi:O-antigen/teichoic acid export membrane protein